MQLTIEDREELEQYKQQHSKRIQERNKQRKERNRNVHKKNKIGIYHYKRKGDSEQH